MDQSLALLDKEEGSTRHGIYRFEDFVLDTGRCVLLREGREIPLRTQSFDMLLLLVTRAGELVSKEFLLKSIWGDSIVTENSITQCMREIRQAIHDHELKKIRTVPKRGYIFDLPVDESESPNAPLPVEATHRSYHSWGVVAVLVVAVVTWWGLRGDLSSVDVTPAREPPANSIAVLPFTDMSANSGMGYLADGLSEEILNQLAQVDSLVVIARTSSFSFRGENMDVANIGNQLNVAHVLEGSLRVVDRQVRVIVQLIETTSQAHLWSGSFEQPLEDIFGIQKEIAAEVARELIGQITDGAGRPHSDAYVPNPKAYQAVLEGQMFYQRLDAGDMARARDLFELATQLDPDYALAWARLSAAIYKQYAEFGDLSFEEAMASGAPAAARAVELEPNLAEALFRAARFTGLAGDRKKADIMRARSFELEPNSPLTLSARAGKALMQGDISVAVQMQKKAVARDPLSAAERHRLCFYLYFAGEYDEFWTQLRVLRRLSPESEPSTYRLQTAIHLLDEQIETAVDVIDDVPEDIERDALNAMMTGVEGRSGMAADALKRLESDESFLSSIRLAEVWGFRGDRDRAFKHLAEAQQRIKEQMEVVPISPHLELTRYSQFLAPLRDDPRWGEWLAFIDHPLS